VTEAGARPTPSDADYRRLLAFRSSLRRFLRWSEEQAADAGLSAVQHQMLLAIRGHTGPESPTIGEIAEQLLIKHHSAVELVDRAEDAGLVRRSQDQVDRRVVRVELTADGARRLARLTQLTIAELSRSSPELRAQWQRAGEVTELALVRS
jgi:DNA-binding MarR family transcriptional regulator